MAKAFTISDLHMDHYLGSDPSKKSIIDFLTPYLCPADVIIVAGDISNHATCTKKTISALAEMYASVIWTTGNHDMVSYNQENSFDKIQRTVKSIVAPNAHYMNGIPMDLHGRTFGGSMGYCNFSYAEKHFGMSKEYMAIQWKATWYDGRFWNIGSKGPLDVWSDEYSKLSECIQAGANVMVSHIGPYDKIVHPRFHNPATGYFYFDGINLMEQMPAGSVWCFGHTHDMYKLQVGNVMLMCNPFGYPGEERNEVIPKEEFIFDL